jgi:ankyrin repeat protein
MSVRDRVARYEANAQQSAARSTSIVDLLLRFVSLNEDVRAMNMDRTISQIEALCQNPQVNINARCLRNDATALYIAAQYGLDRILETLIRLGCSVKGKSQNVRYLNCSPLHIAIWHGRVGIVSQLIKAGASTVQTDSFGNTPLIIAIRHNDYLIVRALLNGGATVDSATFNTLGLFFTHPLLLEFLNFGIPIESMHSNGKALMHYTAERTEKDIELLLSLGADIDATDRRGFTPLMTGLIISSTFESHTALELIVVAGADVNIIGRHGVTACHCAVASTPICKLLLLLLAAGADCSVASRGELPLHHLITYHGDVAFDCAEVLIAASQLDGNFNHRTMSERALFHGAHSIAKLIIESKENPDILAPAHAKIDEARRDLARRVFARMKPRAFAICVALQSLQLPALVTLYIVDAACDPTLRVAMHTKWSLITIVKHFVA